MNEYDPNQTYEKVFAIVGQKAVIVNSLGKILLMKRSNKTTLGGQGSLPGGGLEMNEDPFVGIKREIDEETKLRVTELKPFSLRSCASKENDFMVMVGYQCFADSDDVILNWEHDEYKWITKEEALKMDMTPDGRFFIESFK